MNQLEEELKQKNKASEELKSQADQKKLDSVRSNEKIAELERLVEAKTRELEDVNREKSEHETVISVLESQVGNVEEERAQRGCLRISCFFLFKVGGHAAMLCYVYFHLPLPFCVTGDRNSESVGNDDCSR